MAEERHPSVSEVDKLIAQISGTLLALMSGFASLLITQIRWMSAAVLFSVGSLCFTLSLWLSLTRYLRDDPGEDAWAFRRVSIFSLLFGILFPVAALIGALYQSMLSPGAADPYGTPYIPAIIASVVAFLIWRESGKIIRTMRSRPAREKPESAWNREPPTR